MYAIVKTGGKQYKVCPGDKINIEKLPVAVGDKVKLDAICIVDGEKVEADPEKAAATTVEAVVLEQFKDKKQLVFKFKKRKNYKRLRGHRQQLTRVQITSVGSEKYEAPKAEKKTTKKDDEKTEAAKSEEKKTTAKKAATTKKTKAEDKPKTEAKKTASKPKAKAEDKPA